MFVYSSSFVKTFLEHVKKWKHEEICESGFVSTFGNCTSIPQFSIDKHKFLLYKFLNNSLHSSFQVMFNMHITLIDHTFLNFQTSLDKLKGPNMSNRQFCNLYLRLYVHHWWHCDWTVKNSNSDKAQQLFTDKNFPIPYPPPWGDVE